MAKTSSQTGTGISQDDIARCAYELWEREGRPNGRAAEHWLQAEALLRQGNSQSSAAAEKDRMPGKPAGRSTTPRREKRLEMVS